MLVEKKIRCERQCARRHGIFSQNRELDGGPGLKYVHQQGAQMLRNRRSKGISYQRNSAAKNDQFRMEEMGHM